MGDATDIYVGNFTEGLKHLQRYIVFGFGSSLFFFILVESRGLIESQGKGVTLPGGFLPADPTLAGWIVLTASFVSCSLALFTLDDVERVAAQLRERREILLAILTYPGIATSSYLRPRLVATLTPVILLAIALPTWLQGFRGLYRLALIGFFCGPYLRLALTLRRPVGHYELHLMTDG